MMTVMYGQVFCDYGFSARYVFILDYKKASKFERNLPFIYACLREGGFLC